MCYRATVCVHLIRMKSPSMHKYFVESYASAQSFIHFRGSRTLKKVAFIISWNVLTSPFSSQIHWKHTDYGDELRQQQPWQFACFSFPLFSAILYFFVHSWYSRLHLMNSLSLSVVFIKKNWKKKHSHKSAYKYNIFFRSHRQPSETGQKKHLDNLPIFCCELFNIHNKLAISIW